MVFGVGGWIYNYISLDPVRNFWSRVTTRSSPTVFNESEVRNTLNGWAASIKNKDMNRHLNYYAQNLAPYYGRKNADINKVRTDMQKAFTKYNTLDIQLNNIEFFPDSSGVRVNVIFDKKFNLHGSTYYEGMVQQQLWLEKIGGIWRITGQNELKTYYVNSGVASG